MYIRNMIRRQLIESYPIVVSEMKRYYQRYGRPDSVWGRGKLGVFLYVKYGLLKLDPSKEKIKKYEKLTYPESMVKQPVSFEEWQSRIDKFDSVVFDTWNVLLYPILNEYEFWSMAESITDKPGLFDAIKKKYPVEEQIYKKSVEIINDFSLDNEYMRRLYIWALNKGKNVYICNKSRYLDDEITENIIKMKGYTASISRDYPEDALIISTTLNNNYVGIRRFGDRYRSWHPDSVVTSLHKGLVNLKLHG